MSATSTASARVRACLDTIQRENGDLKAVISVMPDQALEAAHLADEATERGDWQGVLHGMPVSVKDQFATAGVRTTLGSDFYRDHIPAHDAEAVRRLKAAGAIIIAKDNMHEFASGATTQNPHFGSCRNPWNVTRIPGGSSGGSAVTVASGMAIGSVGTDAGGSVRLPAALCGVVGLRPTYGSVSCWNDGLPDIDEFVVPGVLARRVVDVARLFVAIEGYDHRDRSSTRGRTQNIMGQLLGGIRRLRIGIPVGSFFDDVDPEIASAMRFAIDVLRSLGADAVEISLPDVDLVAPHFNAIRWAQGAAALERHLTSEPERFGQDVLEALMSGLNVTGVEYARAISWRRDWKRSVADLFDQVDVVISPTSPTPAPPLTAPSFWMPPIGSLLRAWSMAGVPSMSLPCGFTDDNMPIGMEMAGQPWAESRLLQLGVAYQAVTDWHLRRPPAIVA